MQQTFDLSNCDKEPIHIPGSIQSHGFLLVVHEHTLAIIRTSDNTASFTNYTPEELLNRSVRDLFPENQMRFLLDLVRDGDFQTLNPLHVVLDGPAGSRRYNCIINRTGGALLLDFEPAPDDATELIDDAFQVLNDINNRLRSAASIHELCAAVCASVRACTHYDRVMIYRFDTDWHGEVVAEARAPEMPSFEGHHYPASDIPRQAREMFFRNWIRIIPDVGYTPSPLLPETTASTPPTDLTSSTLRAVSPIHIQYLKNMEVGASLTISIIADNKLWGLIACHHRTPRFISYDLRRLCELIGRMFSSHLRLKEEIDDLAYTTQTRAMEEALYLQMHREMSIVNMFQNSDRRLLSITGANGAALNYRGRLYMLGTTPTAEQLDALYHWLGRQSFSDVYYTNVLSQHFAAAEHFRETAAGILALPISRSSEEYLIWFRPEVIQTIRWAGNPDKAASINPATMQINPRQSFEVWQQAVYGMATPWKKAEIDNALSMQIHIQEVIVREYRQIGRAGLRQSPQENIEIRVLEQTIELRQRQQQLQLQLEQSRMEKQRLHYIYLLNDGINHLLRNRLANMSLAMSHSASALLDDVAGGAPPADDRLAALERMIRHMLEYSDRFTDLSRANVQFNRPVR